MLSSIHRIRSTEFPTAARGTVVSDSFLRISVRKDKAVDLPRCAVIVSGKIAKTAVVRNRIRRRVYAALERLSRRLPAGFIAVFPQKADLTTQEAEASLENLICSKK